MASPAQCGCELLGIQSYYTMDLRCGNPNPGFVCQHLRIRALRSVSKRLNHRLLSVIVDFVLLFLCLHSTARNVDCTYPLCAKLQLQHNAGRYVIISTITVLTLVASNIFPNARWLQSVFEVVLVSSTEDGEILERGCGKENVGKRTGTWASRTRSLLFDCLCFMGDFVITTVLCFFVGPSRPRELRCVCFQYAVFPQSNFLSQVG
jgi:hypothetical protein